MFDIRVIVVVRNAHEQLADGTLVGPDGVPVRPTDTGTATGLPPVFYDGDAVPCYTVVIVTKGRVSVPPRVGAAGGPRTEVIGVT